MLCQICNKRAATVHYTKIVNGEMEELHLCEECAMYKKELEFDTNFSFHKLLTGLIDSLQSEPVKEEGNNLICPNCNLSYAEFKQIGKFGCPECYRTFKEQLYPLFKGIHGHYEHVGKIPKGVDKTIITKKEIGRLKKELEKLVAKEAFEEAAVVRDKINKLKKELDG
ncbi:protein arginine kinase activator [Keratinibaculum paraultunense]|uniref:Protein arginine kinase activator n=1 Tax=Keratinibaculum paraultunense TaxID=1278232 RepID=A0A4R3KW05_9FIRM|nr:UvrB/UvrC motif-containing protein [Keratinibaculum paraultunense]QQY79448.1 UvrB/UvrC motif-containing protein [Keratinibaculum paraultunense]TCS88059.1 protein arginine kinase activator [Keratinibaculum paraultunense]